jgi:hypothetical protein
VLEISFVMAYDTFKVGELTATIGDNQGLGLHRPGYNGVWSLRYGESRSLFVPDYAGLDFEFIFNGNPDVDERSVYEPRASAMTFHRISETEAELYQPPTPTFHLESWTRFKLVPPWYLDMGFRCVAHQHVFYRDYIGLFWASYIDGPTDKSIYFRGGLPEEGNLWSQLCTNRHASESTVRARGDKIELTFHPRMRDVLYRHLSPLRFDHPFFYGLFDDLVWLVIFDRDLGVRFAHSPSGGGVNASLHTGNPAWDFLYIIPGYEVLKPYTLNVRTVLRPRCSREEILREVNHWQEKESSMLEPTGKSKN